jgi:hypothetical protein
MINGGLSAELAACGKIEKREGGLGSMWNAIWRLVRHPFPRWLGTVIFATLGVYGTFFYEHKPDISFEIVSSANVLDIRESLNKLAIVYDGTDLRATNQNLHLLVLRIVNRGSSDVLKSSFDDGVPLGFKVNAGKIVESPSIVGDGYLKDNLRPTVRDDRTVTFAPVIINAGESFQVRALLLVPEGVALTITPIGKIAGVKSIGVIAADSDRQNASYWHEVFYGSLPVQCGRLIGYFLGFLACAAALGFGIGIPVSMISGKVGRSRRTKLVQRYRDAVDRRLTLKEEYLARQYIDETTVFTVFARIVRPSAGPPIQSHAIHVEGEVDGRVLAELLDPDVEEAYEVLSENGLIVRDGPQLELDADFAQPAREFINFVIPISSKADGKASADTAE